MVADTDAHRAPLPLTQNGKLSLDPLDSRQLKMQGCTTKVDSIGARLGSENGFDGVISCTSVESSGESKVGLLVSETERPWIDTT
jgi:hypothetical protein